MMSAQLLDGSHTEVAGILTHLTDRAVGSLYPSQRVS